MSDLSELIGRVEAATGDLSVADGIALWCMSAKCELVDHTSGERGLDGYWVYNILVQEASGRKRVALPEWQLPDRSVDAALALFERKLPGWDYGLDRDEGDFFATIYPQGALISSGYQGTGASIALAVLSALLRALQSQERGS